MRTVRQRVIGAIGFTALIGGALVGAVAPGASPASAAAVNIRLLTTNDFHGRIEPSNTVRYSGTIEQQRASAPGGPTSVLFSAAGDLVGASLFASANQNDDPTIDVFNALGLHTSSVGNHEFDKGEADLKTHIDPRANWDYTCANCYTAGTTTPAFPEFKIFTVGTVTVGFIGAVTQETPSLVSPSGIANLTFGDPVEAINRVATQLSDLNPLNGEAQVLVVNLHEGGPALPTVAAATAASTVFNRIVNDTSPLVDVIFTGHTHQRYSYSAPKPGGGVNRPIVQTGQYGEFIGQVDLVVDDVTGTVTAATGSTIARVAPPGTPTAQQNTDFDNALIAASARTAQVKTIVDAALAAAAAVGNTPIGRVSADITTGFAGGTYTNGLYTGGTRDERRAESTLSNLVADALADALAAPNVGGAEIGVVNPGGLRAELLLGTDGGVITFSEANAVLPFVNNLHTITLTGAQLKTLLEQQWQRTQGGTIPAAPRDYLQLGLSTNFTYTYDPARAEGDRVTSMTVNGAPVDPARGYRVGTFSFLTDGGDNFHVFRQGTNKRDSGLIDRDAWIAYLTSNSPLSPDFGRQGVQVSPTPPTNVTLGQQLTFTVGAAAPSLGSSTLDMTSLGSPQNTSLDVIVGGTTIATVPVTNGVANVNVAVPATLPTGARNITLVAKPSGTVVWGRSLNSIAPTRLFDTRPGETPGLRTVGVNGRPLKVGPAMPLQVKVTDLPGLVPSAGVAAVSLNVAVTNTEGAGFITVYPCGERKLVANVNYLQGETVSNGVIAPVSETGMVCFYSLRTVDLVVDINGWFPDGGYNPVEPNRVFDTRANESPSALRTVPKAQISGDPALQVQMINLGTNGSLVPGSGVGAVSLNVAITNPSRAGWLQVYPCNARQLVASINFAAGETVSNSIVVPVSSTGNLCFYSPVATDVVVDINGWFASSSSFKGLTPNRVFDTRANESPNALVNVAKVKVSREPVLEVKVTGLPNLTPESGVGAVSLNVAVTNPDAAGFVTVYPCGATRTLTASINYAAGDTVSNSVIAPVSATGTVCFYSLVPTNIVVDINGYYAS